MPSYQGLSMILVVVVSMVTQSVETFGGRRKNMAHIFGKRANYKDSDDTMRDLLSYMRTINKPSKNTELRDFDYLFSPDTGNQEAGYPLVGADDGDFSALADDDSISQSDMIRLHDIADIGESGERNTAEIRQMLASFILNRLAKYEK